MIAGHGFCFIIIIENSAVGFDRLQLKCADAAAACALRWHGSTSLSTIRGERRRDIPRRSIREARAGPRPWASADANIDQVQSLDDEGRIRPQISRNMRALNVNVLQRDVLKGRRSRHRRTRRENGIIIRRQADVDGGATGGLLRCRAHSAKAHAAEGDVSNEPPVGRVRFYLDCPR